MENIVNKDDAGAHFRKFNHFKEQANHFIHDEIEDQKSELVNAGNSEDDFNAHHPAQTKLSTLIHLFLEKNEE